MFFPFAMFFFTILFSVFNLGTGHGTSVKELIKTFEKVNNVKVKYEFASRRDGDIPISFADTSLSKKKLDWHPKNNLENMCKDGWKWQKNFLKNNFF